MRYKEILRLKEMLENANIPFSFTDDFFGAKKRTIDTKYYPAYQIVIARGDKKLCDCIEHVGSYGSEEDKLEIMGALTEQENENDSVLGCLTAEEVFKRFEYCYKHKTKFYKEEE